MTRLLRSGGCVAGLASSIVRGSLDTSLLPPPDLFSAPSAPAKEKAQGASARLGNTVLRHTVRLSWAVNYKSEGGTEASTLSVTRSTNRRAKIESSEVMLGPFLSASSSLIRPSLDLLSLPPLRGAARDLRLGSGLTANRINRPNASELYLAFDFVSRSPRPALCFRPLLALLLICAMRK